MKNISFIGAGNIAKAIEGLLSAQETEVQLWDKDESINPDQGKLEDVVRIADYLFLCVPSWCLQEAIDSITPFLSEKTIIISVSKGIEKDSLRTVDKILEESFLKNSYCLLSGPMLAKELSKGMIGMASLATKDKSIFDQVQFLFKSERFWIEYSSDLKGTALCGVLKNVYTLSLGIANGLDWGCNAKGFLFSQSIREMQGIIKILGGEENTVLGPAGLGDLIGTGMSPTSQNYQVGMELCKTTDPERKSEGYASFPSVLALVGDKINEFPLFLALKQIIVDKKPAPTIFKDFIEKLSRS